MPQQKQVIAPPWIGWKDDLPANIAPINSFRQITNCLINKGRLSPFFNRSAFGPIPTFGGIAYPSLAARTFTNTLGFINTVFFTQYSAYYWTPAAFPSPPWFRITNLGTPSHVTYLPVSSRPYQSEVMYGNLFFANGGDRLAYIIGDDQAYYAGDVPGTCLFLGKLDSHLLMINTTEPDGSQAGATLHASRIRWSASGNPFVWITNPVTMLSEPTAGFIDIADVEDQLTGYATIGPTGYAFRNEGITAISVTGSLPPFKFENFSNGPEGIGCAVPYSLANFGNFCVFVSDDDIYYFDGANAPSKIGGSAKRSIFKSLNLARAVGPVSSLMFDKLGAGVDYLAYWLICPIGANLVDIWIYHFDDQSWVKEQLNVPFSTCFANVVTS